MRIVLCYPVKDHRVQQIQAAAPDAEIVNAGQERVAEHLPSAATCSNTVRLPPLTAAEALEEKLAKALAESQFGVE